MIVYFDGDYIPQEEVKISPFDRGFLFADGVYEVMRTYNGKIFKLDEHKKRLSYSLKEIRIRSFDVNTIDKVLEELLSRNQLSGDVNIYIQITRGASSPRTHAFPPADIKPTIYMSTYQLIPNNKENETGIKVKLAKDIRWTRCDIKSISLLPSILIHQSAKENGYSEAIFVRDGLITEGSHTNFFAVKDNIIYTPPLSNYILAGVTRKVLIKICRSNSLRIEETDINEKHLKTFDEFFITGTTTEIKPVIQVDDWVVKTGKPGKLTLQIQKIFSDYVNSKT